MIKKIPPYRIDHLIRIYTLTIKWDNPSKANSKTALDNFENDQNFLLTGKKNQLVNHLVSQALAHFTTCAWARNGQKIAGDILHDLSDENERGKSYGDLIKDPRRR